ncbi:hypothetical protein EXIGLDRAFT_50932 [Exidia glandulosa HHB12029]|uniref:Uncharacterized protein n=1 Tax=Exidia glandulosa HHB12029 TaxID=1314781 RepID=A0A165IDX1_EXIGL|nr:hypothetical protein EXIGLDRAFT_50932 [Exidia glandulosa HHB12029]
MVALDDARFRRPYSHPTLHQLTTTMAPSALTATELEKVNALLKKTFGTCSHPADLAATLVRLVNSCQALHTTAVAAKKKRTRVEMETESAVIPVSSASAIPHASVLPAQSVAPSPDKLRTREWCDLLRGIMACSDSPSSLTLALVAIKDLIQAQCNIVAPVPPLSPRYRDRTPDGSSSPLIHPYYFGVLSSPSQRGASASPRVGFSPCHAAQRADELSSPTPPPRPVHCSRVSTAITPSPSTSSSSQHVSSSPMSDSPHASPVPALSAEDAAYAAWHDLVARALGVYARVCALSTPSRLRIRNVCHKLRVDLGTPELWTDVSRPRSNKHDVFDAVLQLSGSHNFTVNIDSAGCGDAELNFAALALHAARLRGLSVTSSMYKHVPEMGALLVAYTGRLETCRLAFPSTPAILRPGRFPGPAVTTLACLVNQLVGTVS